MDIIMEEVSSNEEEQTGIRMRPGSTEQIVNDQTYVGPSVFGPRPGLSLAKMKKPELRQAVEMPGGVS